MPNIIKKSQAHAFRIRWLFVSAMKMSPLEATATPNGPLTVAAAAAPPSTPNGALDPVPAMVDIMPREFTFLVQKSSQDSSICQESATYLADPLVAAIGDDHVSLGAHSNSIRSPKHCSGGGNTIVVKSSASSPSYRADDSS